MKQYLLGIDIGTTGTKTLLISTKGEIAAHASYTYGIMTPGMGLGEQKAQDWWHAVTSTVRECVSVLEDPADVRAISLSLQGGTVVPTDSSGEPLRNAIVWTDSRAGEQMRSFLREGGSDQYTYETCGWHMGSGLPALQVRWIKDHEPEIFARTAKFLTVPDYVSMRMTGIPAVDLADAGINEFCDIRRGRYDEKLLSFAGIRADQLGEIVHTGDVIGHLTKEAADELGLTEETLLVAGAHDQYAVAVGAGANHAGDVVIGSGTAWVVTGIFDTPHFESSLAQSVAAVPGMWGSIFSLSTGGVCMEWMKDKISRGLSYDEINAVCGDRMAAQNGLFFYPFQGIAGEGRRFARAAFTGMDLSHDCFDLIRAVMEGVVFQTGWMLESFGDSSEGLIRLAGGASKSPVWTQLTADILDAPVMVPAVADLSCVGAAVIAGWGAGLFGSIDEGCACLRIGGRTVLPDPAASAEYQSVRDEYRRKAAVLWEMDHT